MKGGRSFIILLVIALALGGYAYFVESERDPLASTDAKKEKVFTADSSKFEEITIHAATGEDTTLKKANGLWEIVKPETLPGDSNEISSLVSTIESLEIQRVIVEKPGNLADFGLEPARIKVSFKSAGDAAPHELLIGRKTPTGADLYALVSGQSRVFLISGSHRQTGE